MSRVRFGCVLVGIVVFAIVAAAVAAPKGALKPVHTYLDDPPDGPSLSEAYGVAVSPDGKSVYAISDGDSTLNAFSRSKSGRLTLIDKEVNGSHFGGMFQPSAVAVSPDGKNVYVTSTGNNAIVTFGRKGSGKLDYENVLTNISEVQNMVGPCCQIAISRDGRNVYVPGSGSDAIVIFKRSGQDGGLTYTGAKVTGQGGVDGLGNPEGVAISPDGKNVYATGADDNSLVSFTRHGKAGKLSYLDTKFDGAAKDKALNSPCCSLSISRDGETLYIPAEGEQALGEMKRSPKTGKVSFWRAYRSSDKGFGKLIDPIDVIPSPDGKRVWVASYDNSVIFSLARNDEGKLRAIDKLEDGDPGVENINGVWRLAQSPDGTSVYSGNYNDNSLTVLARTK